MTDETFDKRTNTIANTLATKYGVDISSLSEEDIQNFNPKNKAYDLVNKYSLINQAKTNWKTNKKKAADIFAFQVAEKKRKEEEKKKIITNKTIQDNKNDGPGSWGGHGSVEAYDKSQQATYDRAVDRHTGAQGGLATMFTRRR